MADVEKYIGESELQDRPVKKLKLVIKEGAISTRLLADQSVTTEKIQDGAVVNSKLADESVTTEKIKNGNVTTDKILDGSVVTEKIADNAVITSKIKDGAVTTSKILDSNITTDKIASGAVTADKILNDSVTSDKIQDGTIVSRNIAEQAITGTHIQDDAIESKHIKDNSIPGSKLKDGTIESVDIKDNSLEGSKLVDNSILGSKIADSAIESRHLKDNSIPASKILDGTIESIDIKDGTLDGSKIKDNTITSAKLADNAVTSEKIIDNSITTDKIDDLAVSENKIVDGAVTGGKIGTGAVTTDKINDGAVTTDKIPDNNIITSKIADNAITTSKIADSNVTTDKIANLNVTTAKIADGAVTEAKLADGAITPEKIADNTITELQTIMDEVPTEGSVKPVMSGGVYAELDKKANKDGYYGSMTVGTAENLVGRGSVEAEYTGVRTSAGTADIGSGSATITKMMGNSVKWNQINKVYIHRDYLTPVTQTDFLTSARGYQKTIVRGHKYYSHYKMSAKNITGTANLYPYGIFSVAQTTLTIVINENNEQAEYKIVATATVGSTGYFIRNLSNFTGNDCLVFIVLIDLTEIFGAGNEPATVEDFEAWLAANVGLRDYYPYDAGSIINNGATAITTRGFNLYDHATGKAYLPGKYSDYPQEYEICGTFESISYTDINGNTYVPELTDGKFFNVSAPGELTVVGGNNTDTLVHLVWSGWRNEGEPDYAYESFWKNTLQLNLKTLTGKLNGEGESVVVFPYGLAKIGDVQDEIIGGVTAIKRIGVVDLGTLNWSYQSSDYRFMTSNVKNIKGGTLNLLNLQYKVTTYSQVRVEDKRIGVHSSMYIAVRDDDYSGSASSFKTAMSGILLYYELATPETYILDEELPSNYRIDDFGTEQADPAYTDEINAAIRYDVQYAMNAVDAIRRLPQNYVSATQTQNFSDAQKAQARQNIGAMPAMVVDDVPTAESGNLVKSGGIYSFVPAMAGDLESWAATTQSVEYIQDNIVDTTGGSISINSNVPASLVSLAAKTDFKATALIATGFNLLRYATAIGAGWYFPVPALKFGIINTANEPNGILFTNSDGVNLTPTVYFKPLSAGLPTSVTDGTACTYVDATSNEKTYRFYTANEPGYMIISDIDRTATCAHIGWSKRYDEYISITNENDVGATVDVAAGIHALHSYDLMLNVGGVADKIEKTGTNQITWHRLVDRVQPTWTTTPNEVSEGSEQTYTHTATISTMKSDGAAAFMNDNTLLTVSGTTISYVDTSDTGSTDYVKYELATIATGTANISSSFTVEDWGLIFFQDAEGKAYITLSYAQNIQDSLRAMLTNIDNKTIPVLSEAIAMLYNELKVLKNIVLKASYKVIDAEKYTIMGQDMLFFGTDVPAITPKSEGQWYIDTTHKKVYVSYRVTNNTSDWIPLN